MSRSFASEPYVVKSLSSVTSMNADGTGTYVQTFSFVIQSDAVLRQLSVLTVVFASQVSHGDFVYARVVHSDGSIQETPVGDAIEQPAPVTREAPLYSDLETKQLPIKSLRIGDVLEWQTRITVFHNEVPGQFWGQDTFVSGAVVLDESYELRVPAGLPLTVWTNPRAGAVFSESDAAGQHVYRWSHSDLHPTLGTEAEAAKKAKQAHVLTREEELDETKGKLPSFAWSTFRDWAAVGAWYRNLVADRVTPDAAIKARVAELTPGKTTDLEKAQAVYSFVSGHIRYVGVDFGIGRYQPHSAAEVFANQYGDCKDKHILLASMLSVLNLHADPVLIGAGIRFNADVPSPASFNHLITHLTLNGREVWLDSTAEIGTWGALFKTMRDQEALVIPAVPPAVLARTAADLPYPQTSTEVVTGTLDNNLTSESKITFTLRDDDELVLRSILRNVSPADYGTFMQQMMAGMGFGGTTSDPEIEHIDDPSQPLQLSLHYHRVKEKDWGENRITATFQPIAIPSFTTDQPPTSTIQLGYLRTESSTVNLQLPQDWTVELPEAVHAHAPFATCDVTYSLFKDHVLNAERHFTVLESKVPIQDFQKYQAWYDECGAGGVPFIQLRPKPKVTAAATLPEPTAPDVSGGTASATQDSNAKAADLIRQAQQSLRTFDLDGARTLLDQAEAIHSTEPYLWSGYATIAEQLGTNIQALEDMQRELTYHPEEVQFYPYVSKGELAMGDTKAALATFRAWVKAAPGNLTAAISLGRQLVAEKSSAEALKEVSSTIDRLNPTGDDLTELTILAAEAQVDLGQTSAAANSVAPLLKTVTNPDQLTAITSILAEGSTSLSEAAAAEGKVLEVSEAETATWTTSSKFGPTMRQERRIAAEWDTMGLILFHQGKFSQALGYTYAAFHAVDGTEFREHLAKINSVVHDPTVSASLRADNLRVRSYPLGPTSGPPQAASFTLLLGDGKILDSAPEGGPGSNKYFPNAEQFLKVAKLQAFFPPGSKARFVRTAFVNCHSGACQLILEPLRGQ